jgi:RNA polymerase primary sigma factor
MIQAIAPWPPTIPTILASAQRLTEDIAEDDPPESDLATLWDIDTDAAKSDDVDHADDSELEAADTNKTNEARLKHLTSDSLAILARVGALLDQIPHAGVTESKGPSSSHACVKESGASSPFGSRRERSTGGAPMSSTWRAYARSSAAFCRSPRTGAGCRVNSPSRRFLLRTRQDREDRRRARRDRLNPRHETDFGWTANIAAAALIPRRARTQPASAPGQAAKADRV